ncbi:MAG: putative choline transporter, neither null mutation nor overexpression affects choline transport [Thelocarpon superellum]|nr:MAG: putative choline transporter, neither null mutation nor overexpression affects choline transport [Thelocarpon superellum]
MAAPQQPYGPSMNAGAPPANGQGYQDPKFTQQPPTYTYQPAPLPASGEKASFDQTFRVDTPKWHDVWAGILLILTFCGFVAVSGFALQGYATTKGFNGGGIYDGGNDFSLSTNTVILFAFVLLVALVLSWAYFTLARAFTKQFIWITGILNIVFGIGTAVVYFARHYYSAAIVFLIFSVFYIICFISWIPRIPFSVLILQTVMDVAKGPYGHVFTVSFLGGLVATAFGAWYSVTFTAIYVKYQPGNNPACDAAAGGCSSAKVIGLLVFITFAGYWITEWMRQTIHTTIAGVYGSWYFCSQKPGGVPSGATRGAFRRAMTYSFGSISFGSLIVSLVQLLRQAVSIAQQSESAEGNIVGTILFCVLGCFVGILEWIVQFVNHYAFSHIALYGKAYIPAAKDTWLMIKNRGMDALVNECLIDPVLTMGATFVGYITAFLAYLYLDFTHPAYNTGDKYTPVVMAFAFLIGLQICNVFLTPLKSGVATLFVAAAWDPQVLMSDFPELYARMVAVYPGVQSAIHA